MLNVLGLNGGIITLNNKKYKIYQSIYGFKIVIDKNAYICFEADGKNGGLCFKIKTLVKNNRAYTAQRYLYKYIPFIREISFILCINNYLWDYELNEPLMESREKRGYNKNFSDYTQSFIGAISEVKQCLK